MGTNGASGNFELHNFFQNPPPPGYNHPPAPYPPPGHSYHNFPPNNFPLPSSYGSSLSSYSNLAASYPFGPQGSVYNQCPPHTQDQVPRGPPYSAPGYGQPYTSMPLSLTLSGLHQNASQTNSTPSTPTLDSARLMALLTNPASEISATTALELPPTDCHSSSSQVELSHPPAAVAPAIPSAPPVSLASTHASGRRVRGKFPRGRYLKDEHVTYDVDVRLAGEAQPQLEHNTITKYVSDPQVLIGRQIAVNRTYICYALRPKKGIRVLNINTALRYLLQGHSQGRVTDMAFFADDVHLLASASSDGRVFVRRIVEDLGEDDKVQISEEILLAIHFLGDWDSVHPRVCWQAHTEDLLVVGIRKYVMTIDLKKVRRSASPDGFSVTEPVLCSVESPVEGVYCVGAHDDDVTDLSSSPSMWLVSASKDGTVRIWRDQTTLQPLTIKPHDGLPVDGVALLSPTARSDNTVLLTAGPLNRELKLWVPAVEGGWYSPSASLSWKCVQILELKSSSGEEPDVTFFNQLLVLPRIGIILVPNARRNALYVIHMNYGSNSAVTRMDYLAEFSVMMPILSITATIENEFDGEGMVQVYCVQTEAIQQYALDLSLCMPPSDHTMFNVVENDLKGSLGSNLMNVEASSAALEVSAMLRAKSPGPISGVSLTENVIPGSHNPAISIESSSITDASMDFGSGKNDSAKAVSTGLSHIVAPTPHVGAVALSPRGSPTLARTVLRSLTAQNSPRERLDILRSFEQTVENKVDMDVIVQDTIPLSTRRTPIDVVRITEDTDWQVISSSPASSVMPEQHSGSAMHLVTPSELMSMVARSKGQANEGSSSLPPGGFLKESTKLASRLQDFVEKEDLEVLTVETKEVTDSTCLFPGSMGIEKERKDLVAPGFRNRDRACEASDYLSMDIAKAERDIVEELGCEQEIAEPEQSIVDEVEECLPTIPPVDEQLKEVSVKVDESSAVQLASQSRKKKNKNKADANPPITLLPSSAQMPGPSSAPLLNVPDQDLGSNHPLSSAVATQFLAMQDSINQLLSMQREFQKHIGAILAVPIAKEVKKMEVTLGQRMEKALKAQSDAVWARLQEESMKREKLEKDRMQQLTSIISAFFSKDMPTTLEKALKKELSSLGSHVTRLVIPSIEKAITTSLNESFQKGFGDKGVAQLEKSVGAKIEALVSRQLQTQFHTSGKQALQEGLRSCLEASLTPAFERACQEMFGQVDAAFQKGLKEHRAQAHQQLTTSHCALVASLQETIASASSLAAFMKGDLADGQRKLIALVENAGGARMTKTVSGSLPEKAMTVELVESSLDPTKELSRLISERKLEEAFTKALSLSDVGVVSWLCNQVDFAALFTMSPIPLSQGVLLALVQQLGCDLGNDTGKKLMWIKDAALHLNPHDPVLAPHMRQFLEKLYNHLLALAETSLSPELANSTRLVIHVVHSLLSVYANEAKYTHYLK